VQFFRVAVHQVAHLHALEVVPALSVPQVQILR
jgi:hypothetical protein